MCDVYDQCYFAHSPTTCSVNDLSSRFEEVINILENKGVTAEHLLSRVKCVRTVVEQDLVSHDLYF